ncbi:hypothetical protein [Taibaiella helva]|uniref:hypothetical protein n=1 Tax=Taibaiella helva TaxID=2301235 RepID=UPI000E584ECC|nr:hypothetical protein [Taibaiella helva]
MVVKPNNNAAVGLFVILFSINVIVLLFIPFLRIGFYEVIQILLGIFLIDILLGLMKLREYKTFILCNEKLVIKYSFIKFGTQIYMEKNILNIKVVRYSIQNRIAPVMIMNYLDNENQSKKKKISFRLEDKKVEFQNLIDQLRAEGIVIECEGDVWF